MGEFQPLHWLVVIGAVLILIRSHKESFLKLVRASASPSANSSARCAMALKRPKPKKKKKPKSASTVPAENKFE